jgi:hypothetical protein
MTGHSPIAGERLLILKAVIQKSFSSNETPSPQR